MDPDTDIGGPLHRFPATNHSAILGARSDDQLVRRRAFDTILTSYWKPAYKYIRLRWHIDNEDAKDLTQGFFANAFEKNHFATYDLAIGFFAKKFHSLPIGILFGVFVGALLAFLVALMQGGYYFEIIVPGTLVGLIVGFATQKYGKTPATANS